MILNVVFIFLSQKIQNIIWVIVCAIVFSIIILVVGINQTVQSYCSYRFADISKDGIILGRKNFPWEVTKTTNSDSNIVFIIEGRYGDSSEISVIPDQPAEVSTYNAMSGVAIKFQGPEKEIPNFRIEIKK